MMKDITHFIQVCVSDVDLHSRSQVPEKTITWAFVLLESGRELLINSG